MLTALFTAAELIHKAATVTFNKQHIARTINTRRRLMKTKRNRRKIPSSAQSAYTNESLNNGYFEVSLFFNARDNVLLKITPELL